MNVNLQQLKAGHKSYHGICSQEYFLSICCIVFGSTVYLYFHCIIIPVTCKLQK